MSIPFGYLLIGNNGQLLGMDKINEKTVLNRRLRLKLWLDMHFQGQQSAFIEATGINQGELSGLLKSKSFGEKKARTIEKQAGMPYHWLEEISKNTSEPASNVMPMDRGQGDVPLISWVKAGEWCEAVHGLEPGDAEDWIPCSTKHGKRTYALRVVGDSMTAPYPGKKSYPEGCLIFVDPDVEPNSGNRVVAKLPDSNEATFKEYRTEGGKHYLKPLNPQYPIIEMTGDMHICGVVVGKWEDE
jgi:SOS-response transcriptional repressor LexA